MSSTLEQRVTERGIDNVLHFSTNRGLTGILASGAVKPRSRLEDDQYLEFIFEPNAEFRKDRAWLDFVNLSLGAINASFFEVCANKWHAGRNIFWVVLAFPPEILLHPGVHFATTNNIYTGVARGAGSSGFEALFAPEVVRWTGTRVRRPRGLPAHLPTDEQAEVLYPGDLSTVLLRTIFVPTVEAHDLVSGQLAIFPHADVQVIVEPNLKRRSAVWDS